MDQFRHTKKFMRSVLGLLCKFLDRAGFEVDIFIPVRPYLLMRTELASFITTFLQGCFLRKCHLTSILANTSDKNIKDKQILFFVPLSHKLCENCTPQMGERSASRNTDQSKCS